MPVDYALLDRAPLARPLFYPRPDPSIATAGAHDLRIEVEPGIEVAARHHVDAASQGTVLYFHGNGEIVGDHDTLAQLYRAIGLDLFVVDYRGYGRSDGEPSFAALVADAHPIAARFHQRLDAAGHSGLRLVMGHSLGGHPALEIAARCPSGFHGLVLSSAAGDGQQLVSRIPTAPRAEVDALLSGHAAKLARITLPTLLLHGGRDEVIPLRHAERLHAQLSSAEERELVVFPRADHNDVLWVAADEYFEAIRQLAARCRVRAGQP